MSNWKVVILATLLFIIADATFLLGQRKKQEGSTTLKGPVYTLEVKQTRFRNGLFKRAEVIITWFRTVYDKQRKEIEEITYNDKGKPDGKESFSYDVQGNQIERIRFDSKNEIAVKVNRK